MELSKGSRLGNRFKVLGCLGSGKMGTVFIAADAAHEDRVVALKVFHQQLLKNSSDRQKLRERISVVSDFTDELLVHAIEYVDEPGLEALSLEYVPGGNLQSLVAESALDFDEIIGVLKQVAQALAVLHNRGLVHWDLKPSSILFTKEGRVKLSGYGLSKILSAGPINLRIGDAQYRAPEYLRHGDCDQRGDIYSLGVIGYELVTASTPLGADDTPDSDEGNSIPETWPRNCPPALRAVLEKAMASSPGDRFQSAQEFEGALARARNDRGASPRFKGAVFLCAFSAYVALVLSGMYFIG